MDKSIRRGFLSLKRSWKFSNLLIFRTFIWIKCVLLSLFNLRCN